MTEVKANTWYQLHTNGASVTFARYYKGTAAGGADVFIFEKLDVDLVVSSCQLYSVEAYVEELEAMARLTQSMAQGI
jgi:hypothetical protein